jgi:hypothetical protein
MPTVDHDMALLLTNLAELVRHITDAPPDQWGQRVTDLADALDRLAAGHPDPE